MGKAERLEAQAVVRQTNQNVGTSWHLKNTGTSIWAGQGGHPTATHLILGF